MLDLLKLLASYMVVYIHVFSYGSLSVATDALARCAVPFFFAATGFYSYGITPEKIKKRIVYLLRLFVFSVVFCVSFDIILLLLNNDVQAVTNYFSLYLNIKNILNLLLFNNALYSIHLWYLLALIYVYTIMYFLTLYKVKEKIIFAFAIACLVLHFILAEGLSIFGVAIEYYYVRNFALMGFPFFVIGLIAQKYVYKLEKLSSRFIFVFGAIGILLTLLSRKFFGKNELYVGSFFLMIAMMLIFIKYSNIKCPKAIVSIASCNTFVYIIHFTVSKYLWYIYAKIGIGYSVCLALVHPLLVCFLSTVLACAVKKVDKLLRVK